jgi:lipase chaperone LimK
MQPRIAVAIVSIAAALAAMMWWSPQHGVAPPSTVRDVVTQVPSADLEANPGNARMPVAAPAPTREDSLRGTQVDGAVNFDADGRPVADRDLRRLFDYFLTRLGERSPAAIRNDLLVHLRDSLHLDNAARLQVLGWFDAYVATQRAATELAHGGNLADDFARLRALHREQLGDELSGAFYGAEDDYAAYTAQRMALERDTSLTPTQRDTSLAQLEAQRDPAQRAAQQASTDFQLAVAQTEQFAADRADAATRHDERAALWGEEAAQRLALLDRQEAEWNARLAAYARSRAGVLADGSLTPAAREARLAALLQGFAKPEQLRVLALADAGLLPKN